MFHVNYVMNDQQMHFTSKKCVVPQLQHPESRTLTTTSTDLTGTDVVGCPLRAGHGAVVLCKKLVDYRSSLADFFEQHEHSR